MIVLHMPDRFEAIVASIEQLVTEVEQSGDVELAIRCLTLWDTTRKRLDRMQANPKAYVVDASNPHGRLKTVVSTISRSFTTSCPDCKGTGACHFLHGVDEWEQEECETCSGHGSVPAGVLIIPEDIPLAADGLSDNDAFLQQLIDAMSKPLDPAYLSMPMIYRGDPDDPTTWRPADATQDEAAAGE